MEKSLENQLSTYGDERLAELYDYCVLVNNVPKKAGDVCQKIIDDLNDEIIKLKSDLFIFSVEKSAHHMNALHQQRQRIIALQEALANDESLATLLTQINKDADLREAVKIFSYNHVYEPTVPEAKGPHQKATTKTDAQENKGSEEASVKQTPRSMWQKIVGLFGGDKSKS